MTFKLLFLIPGIVSSLKRLLSDTDATVRHKTTEVLYIIAGHASGRDAFLEHKIITPLSNLVGHNNPNYPIQIPLLILLINSFNWQPDFMI